MEVKRLNFTETLKDAIAIGIKNTPSVIVAVLLWLVTIWVPYINIGTTIAISLLPIELAKGNVINPLGIFDAKYRRYMGEFFITWGLMLLPMLLAFLFMFIPGIVLSLAWTLAFYFLIDKGKNPMQAIKASNDATYGSKWTMFFVVLVFVICAYVLALVFGAICTSIGSNVFTGLIMFILLVVILSISMAINASFWRQLKDNVE